MNSNVLVVTETKGAGWHRMSFEALAAGQKLAAELGVGCSAAVMGEGAAIAPLAAELAAKRLDAVWAVGDALLAQYTADGWVAALEQLIAEAKPSGLRRKRRQARWVGLREAVVIGNFALTF